VKTQLKILESSHDRLVSIAQSVEEEVGGKVKKSLLIFWKMCSTTRAACRR
jgi:hypothetical protein